MPPVAVVLPAPAPAQGFEGVDIEGVQRLRSVQGEHCGSAAALATAALWSPSQSWAGGELNLLVWCDHTDPNLLKPYEDANGVKINVKAYEGTGTAVSSSRMMSSDVFSSASASYVRITRWRSTSMAISFTSWGVT